ncbi:hypothetical protein TNIN_396621 [Trichonephila inaurata madagascariensis]|uniref:Uncharacterized protein n=1 Tax=Trichonephila inaurata madagascariensis TaxID=2747483 RepID=A0A8X6X419_9ARAC|nr:hypothetical protein TNIN_396621 [Trichonephila inaurata madagascariensis]
MAISSGCALWKMQVDFPDIRERRLQFGSSLVDDIRASKSPNESPVPEGRGFIDEPDDKRELCGLLFKDCFTRLLNQCNEAPLYPFMHRGAAKKREILSQFSEV